MSYLSALKAFVENQKEKVYGFKTEIDYGYDRLIVSIFNKEDGKLSMGVDDCGFLFANEINKEDVAQMIVEHLFYVEGEFIPLYD
mgnify:CR=1 FL=1